MRKKAPQKQKRSMADDPPSFMVAHAGKGLEGLTASDLQWTGELPDAVVDAIASQALGPAAALRRILIEIIRSNPIVVKPAPKARLAKAMEALLPLSSPKGKAGQKKSIENEQILTLLARESFARKIGYEHVSTSRLCRKILMKVVPAANGWSAKVRETKIEDICAQFAHDEDALLAAASVDAVESAHRDKHIKEVLKHLTILGVVNPG
jgi:hypothetical protein